MSLVDENRSEPSTSMMQEVIFLPTDCLEVNSWNCNTMSQIQMKNLQSSLAMNGKHNMQPLIVRPLASGRFQIVDGEHRYLAAKNLGWPDIPAIVLSMSEAKAKVMCVSLNYVRGRIDPIKLFEILYADWEGGEGRLTTRELEDVYGQLFDQSWISRILQLRNLYPEVRAHAQSILSREPDSNVSIKHLFVLSELKEKEDQMKFLDALVATSVSVSTFDRMVNEYIEKNANPTKETETTMLDGNVEEGNACLRSMDENCRRSHPSSDSIFRCRCGIEYIVNWRRKTVLRIDEEAQNMKATHVDLVQASSRS